MKVVLLLAVLVAASTARPQFGNPVAAIRNFFDERTANGYRFGYETDDGAKKEETAEIKNAGTDEESLAVTGSYEYVGDDGKTYKVYYTADENGFQPGGEHIPQSAGVRPKLGIPSAAVASLAG